MIFRVLLTAFVLFAMVFAGARADTSVGLEAGVGTVQHQECCTAWERSRATAVAGIVQIEHRAGRAEVLLEGFPSHGPAQFSANSLQLYDTRLTYLGGAVRYWLRDGRTGFGLGENVYNQTSTYRIGSFNGNALNEYESSRVVGARYELLQRYVLRSGSSLDAYVAYNPRMTALLTRDFPPPLVIFGNTSSPERGEQLDGQLRYSKPLGHNRLGYGVRYVHLRMNFVHSGSLADDNRVFYPFVFFAVGLR